MRGSELLSPFRSLRRRVTEFLYRFGSLRLPRFGSLSLRVTEFLPRFGALRGIGALLEFRSRFRRPSILRILCLGMVILAIRGIVIGSINFPTLTPPQVPVAPNPVSDVSDIFHSPEVFKLNYEEMEKKFKVYIYPDQDPDTYYQTPGKITGKFASEGYFFQNIRNSQFRTKDPEQAHLFFIPISCHKMRGKGVSHENITNIIQNYVESIIAKYPYWNRTLGTDHFIVICHDFGVRATEAVPLLVKNSIRVVSSASYDDFGYIPHKDVPLPQVLQPFVRGRGGENDIKNRTTLGFWAGHQNSDIRVTLTREWENDTDLDIQNSRINRTTGNVLYREQFYTTKFCICPGGSQINTVRIADSIHYGCVPVILANYYDLPFNDILDWRKFSVILNERDVYKLKYILANTSHSAFKTLHNNVVKVQKHFEWNSPPLKYDAFHLVMYDLWLRHHVIRY